MRLVKPGSTVWNRPGVGSGDIAALFNCAPDRHFRPLALWARIVQCNDLTENPNLKKVRELDQGSQQWLRWRKDGLGGSEVGCVMGANPYKGSQAPDVWGRKLPEDHPDFVPEVGDNFAMARGRKLEPDARALYESLYGWKVEPLCVVDDHEDCIRCSLDGWNEERRISVEIKCSGAKNHRKYLDIGNITDPFERQTAFACDFAGYRLQVLYQMMITEARLSHFVAFSPDFKGADRLAVFELYPEPQEMQRLRTRVLEFWDFVTSRSPPPPEWLVRCDNLPSMSDLQVPHRTSST